MREPAPLAKRPPEGPTVWPAAGGSRQGERVLGVVVRRGPKTQSEFWETKIFFLLSPFYHFSLKSGGKNEGCCSV